MGVCVCAPFSDRPKCQKILVMHPIDIPLESHWNNQQDGRGGTPGAIGCLYGFWTDGPCTCDFGRDDEGGFKPFRRGCWGQIFSTDLQFQFFFCDCVYVYLHLFLVYGLRKTRVILMQLDLSRLQLSSCRGSQPSFAGGFHKWGYP